jgi:DNA (cytosine-5)-methyltransferase 1
LGSYLKISEAAAILGVSAYTLRYWDRTGRLPTIRHPISGYRLYRREDLWELLRRTEAAVEPREASSPEAPHV